MAVEGYYYLHTNGDFIYKKLIDGYPEVGGDGFVVRVWPVDLSNRFEMYLMLIDAMILGLNEERLQELKAKWQITNEDTLEFVKRYWGTLAEITTDGDFYYIKCGKAVNGYQYGYGEDLFEAVVDIFLEAQKKNNSEENYEDHGAP